MNTGKSTDNSTNPQIEKQQNDKDNSPFIIIDKQGGFFSNFIANFLRQFKKTESLFELLRSKRKTERKKEAASIDIMGPVKPVNRPVQQINNSGPTTSAAKTKELKPQLSTTKTNIIKPKAKGLKL